METEDVMDWLSRAWERIKSFAKYTIESNFTCADDVYFFVILFGSMIAVVIVLTLGAYTAGYDKGETEGLKKGFGAGTTMNDSGR